jgi:hypothetical protein
VNRRPQVTDAQRERIRREVDALPPLDDDTIRRAAAILRPVLDEKRRVDGAA